RPIVVDKDGMILGGNMRYKAIQELKMNNIPDGWVKVADGLTDEEKKRFIVEDNLPFGEWDWDALANQFSIDELLEWGFDEKDLKIDTNNLEELDGEPIKDIKDIKILNLYSSIGRNRCLWGNLDITAVEY